MSNIRVDLANVPYSGQHLTFRSPANCSEITGLIVYYPEGDATTCKTFQFADAHGNNVGSVDLFASDVLVKVILDTELNRAYVQNADTNAYIENEFLKRSGGTMTGPLDMGGKPIVGCSDFRATFINGARIRAYDFGKDNIPFVLDRGGHCAYLVVGRTNSGVCVYTVRVDQGGSNPEVIKMCGGEYANFGFTGDANSLTIHGSSYATCVVISIDNWNV